MGQWGNPYKPSRQPGEDSGVRHGRTDGKTGGAWSLPWKKTTGREENPACGTPIAPMFGSDSDPRSSNYKRILIRPPIPWGKVILLALLPLAATAGCVWGLEALSLAPGWTWGAAVGVPVLWFLLRGKSMVITLVHIYQRYAPEQTRMKCRFEPSCSQYMIQALERHGLFRGLWKGIGRLRRCNRTGGGFDPP